MYQITVIVPDGTQTTHRYENHNLPADHAGVFKWLKSLGKTWIRICHDEQNVLYQITK